MYPLSLPFPATFTLPLAFALLLLCIFTISYYFWGDRIRLPRVHDLPVPRTIWTYLQRETPTPRQALCIATWRSLHPEADWHIHVLTPSTVHGYLHGLPDLRHEAAIFRDPERWEEVIALHALTEHGGIWLHPHTYLRKPLDQCFVVNKKEVFVVSYRDAIPHVRDVEQNALILDKRANAPVLDKRANAPVFDKRAIASAKKNPFMENWKAEYMRIPAFSSVEAYINSIPTAEHPATARAALITDWVMTFALHHSLLQHPYPMESIHQHAIDDGPVRHLFSAKGDPKKAEAIALDPASTEPIVFL